MATISDSIRLNDGFTPVLKNMQQALNLTIIGFERLQQTTDNTMNVREFELARSKIDDIGAEIRQAETEQKRFNNQLKNSNNSASQLSNTIKGMVSAYALYQGGQEYVNAADQYANTYAKLNLINDGLQTTEELNQKIFNSAGRARGSYTEMADIVGKLGITASSAFSSNDEMVEFTELMTKSFKIAGASAQEQSAATYQLTQAMASGRLQGDEFRSILENAPLLAQAIADEMGVSLGALKEMSSEGLITSDVIKSAMFNASEDINSQFEKMPVKFSEITQRIKDNISLSLQPAFQRFSNFLNSDRGQEFFVKLGNGLIAIINIASKFMDIILWIAMIFTEYWAFIEPVIWGIVGSYGAWLMVTKSQSIEQGILALKMAAVEVSMFKQIALTKGLTAAWATLNSVQKANVILFIIGLLIALGVWLYKTWKTNDKFALKIVLAWNAVLGFFDQVPIFFVKLGMGIVNTFQSMKVNSLQLMDDLINGVISGVNWLIEKLNKIPGVSIEAIDSVNYSANAAIEAESIRQAGEDKITAMENNAAIKAMQREYKTYDYFRDRAAERTKDSYMNELFPENSFNLDGLNLDSLNYVDEIGSINDTIDISSEDLKIMRELSERKAIENYVTLTPTVDVKTGDIKNGADIDELVAKIEDMLETDIAASTKVVYDLG